MEKLTLTESKFLWEVKVYGNLYLAEQPALCHAGEGKADTESYKAAAVLVLSHLTKISCSDIPIFPRRHTTPP